MIDHVSVGVSDLERAARFYELALAPLGLSRLVTRPATVGFGKSYPEFWINLRTGMPPVQPGSGVHICLARKKVAQKRCHTTNIEPQTFIQGGSVPSTGPNSQ